jgi:peptidoglycan/xylan/chitin deacetylase (PgdA/CDA1 family)
VLWFLLTLVLCFALAFALWFAFAGPVRAQGQALPAPSERGRSPFIAVLVWHDVLPQKDVWFDTTTATFATQLDAIARGGFHVITLAALRDHLLNGTPVPPKSLVLTFDDNGHGIYENAFPLLERHRFAATLFVHTNFVGKTTSKHHNTWDELRAMERSGLIDVQSQTANHPPDLTKLSDADVLHEFRLSAYSLEHRLGRKIYAVVYPYDVYDARVERLAAQSGYVLGFTEDWGGAGDSASLLEIHRYSILTRFDQALTDVAAHAR